MKKYKGVYLSEWEIGAMEKAMRLEGYERTQDFLEDAVLTMVMPYETRAEKMLRIKAEQRKLKLQVRASENEQH